MKQCPVCKKDFQESMNFCLEDGTVLIDPDQDKTIVIASEMGLYTPDDEDAEQQQRRLIQELYRTDDFADFQFDARFGRLLTRLRQKDYYLCTEFLVRLLGRSMLAERRSQPNSDVHLIWNVLSESSPEAADAMLAEAGLL